MDHRYTAVIAWSSAAEAHRSGRYSRAHDWRFDGGAVVRGSSAPPVPGSDPAAVDPEEAVVAALASCHMLFFLAIARKRGVTVLSYDDDAAGELTPDEDGKLYLSTITLRPRVIVDGPADPALMDQIHHAAHDECYIARSLRAEVNIQPR